MKIVVISPTYNERVNIQKLIPILEEEVFPKVKKHTIELLIVDDYSPDGTADEVRSFKKKWKNITLLEGDKKGLGEAYIRGMRYAMDEMHADAVVEFDSDFQHDPHDIPRLIAAMDEGYDYVIGSRYVPGGKIPPEWGLHRKLMSFFGSQFARIVLLMPHIHDMTSGYKLTKTEFLRKVDLEHLLSKYYAYKIQILHDVVKLGAKVKEVPIIFYERKEGSSKISKKDLFDSFWVVIQLRIKNSKSFIKFLMVGGFGFILQIVVQEFVIRSGIAYFLAEIVHLILKSSDTSAVGQAIGAGIGAETAILSNFFLNNYWTFNAARKIKERSPSWIRLLKFNSTSFLSIFIQTAAVWLGVKLLGNTVYIMSYAIPTRIFIVIPTIILIVIPLNYIIYNKVIWKTQYLKKHGQTAQT